MKRSDSMLTRVEEYLRYRRALGYALRIEGAFHWPNPVRQNHGFLANRLILDLRDYSSL